MKITKANYDDAMCANELLTKLIKDEKKYDDNINENCNVTSFYERIYNSDGVCLLVAKENNFVTGYLYGYIENNGDTYINLVGVLDALYVREEYRCKGVATKLIKEFKLWSIKHNAKEIEVKVLNDNINAINLYRKIGFKNVKTIMNLKI